MARRFGFVSGLVVVALAVISVVDVGEVLAQSSATTMARDAAERARQAYDAGRKQEAIDGYKHAYELSGDASLLFLLGEVSRELGQDVAAVRFYRAYQTRDPRGKHREAADRAIRNLELGSPKPNAAPAAAPKPPVAVKPAPPPPPPAPPRAAAPPPAPPPTATPPRPAPPPIATAPRPAPTPPAPTAPPPLAMAPTPDSPAVDLHAEASPAATPGTPLPRWLPWAGLGATLALGAGAAITGMGASRRYDELSGSCGQTVDGCSQAEIDQVKSRALTANLLWAAAGVGAIATGVTVYVNTREAGFSGVWSF